MFSLFGGNQKKNPESVNICEKNTKNKNKTVNFTQSDIKSLNKMLILLIDNSANLNLDDKTIKKINNVQKIINS
tara:strand:- start:108 stop:329 length:222 start_codon:yes stop_codon:yes gene_type:complete